MLNRLYGEDKLGMRRRQGRKRA